MTARLDAIGSDALAAASRDVPGDDDALSLFQSEPQTVGNGSGDSAALARPAIPSQAASVPSVTPGVNESRRRTPGVVSRIKRVLRALDIAGNFEATVDNRLAALRGLDQEVLEHAGRLEWLKQEMIVVSELEGRLADLPGRHQRLDRLEKCVAQLEQRAAAAVGEVKHATRAKDELQREIAKCHQQIERLSLAAQGDAGKGKGTRWFLRRGPNTSRGLSPARQIFGVAALALSAAIVFLVGIVWGISPVEQQRAERPLRSPALASRALTLAPTLAAAPPRPLTAGSSDDRSEAARPAPAAPAVTVPKVVVPETPPVVTREAPTATLQEQSVNKGAGMPLFVGTLFIESDPAGAAAFVNQEAVGATPLVLKDLRAGSYVVRLEHEGYLRWSTSATVSAVREARVKAKLEREGSR